MATITQTHGRRRFVAELYLLSLAIALSVGAYVLVSLAMETELPSALATHLVVVFGTALVMYVLKYWLAPHADPVILPIAVALNGLGLAMIFRLDVTYLELETYDSFVGTKQLLHTGVGILGALAVLMFVRDHRSLKRYTYLSMATAVVLLFLPILPVIGQEINGARIWINLGVATLQPAELAKILLAIFFASYLANNRDNLALVSRRFMGLQLPVLRYTGPLATAWLIGVGILVLQNDYGTSILLFGLFVVMLYIATDRPSWIVIGFLAVAVAGYGAYLIKPHIANRVIGWLDAMNPEVYDAPGGSYQLVQGIYGLATGGLLGTGLGRGHPTLVPFANSDFIMTSFGEELGLTGSLAMLALYGILVERSFRIAIGSRDGFGKLLASGLGFTMALQVFVVVGGLTRVLPLTGLTMPFLSAGGSSLISSWLIIALLLRMSDAARRPRSGAVVTAADLPPDPPKEPDTPPSLPPPSGPMELAGGPGPVQLEGGPAPAPDQQETTVVQLP
ncbi:FtsW/RodA/SpoVE family cell cycle protein [Buchananella hordeovulneris]|uniref:peptidoglycan glycosyltransferase n=1 Tax=Buchananella hordeovulneris TaxID=52770 RepID=A0A1Q5PUP4_9ACTO|nr:FtsW/RodA/SpoVE family cell cycle protein [Buchananella hordeovulneris]MDO5081446.1 FtsW/RodA/SpoVE family cell cycle protein [Buchananella hordeovulneris]OKL51288.1 hypothetical protein BSZ40_08235 [Buchananella hordeovulneris]